MLLDEQLLSPLFAGRCDLLWFTLASALILFASQLYGVYHILDHAGAC